jgi:glycosidase
MFTKFKLGAAVLALALAGCVSQNQSTETSAQSDEPSYLKRNVQDDVFYFVLPDRFNNGDSSNDQGSKTLAISQGGFKPEFKGGYHGGDISGLQQKLDYIQDMGVTAIWLTPILRNQAVQSGVSGYHGYWVLDFTQIDPHLGSNADLKAFIDAAHHKNIKVFFDIITNHTADVIKFTECHGEDGTGWSTRDSRCPYKTLAQKADGDGYTTVIPKGSELVKSPPWLNDPKFYHNQGDSTFEGENSIYGDFFGLDDIDTDNPLVVRGMIEIFTNLVTEFKPDGFRVDTVKHVNMEFWQQFSPAVIEHAKKVGIPNFFMFGEVYSGDSDVLSSYTTTGKLPSVLDFGFQGAVYQSIVANKGAHHLKALFDNDKKYNDQDSNANQLLNFVGNHDMGRIGYHLNNDEFGWSEAQKIKRSKLAHALMFFARGMPVIYYGDEQGFTGDGGDHAARQDMMPSKVASFNDDVLLGTTKTTADDNFDKTHPLYQSFKEYAAVYSKHHGLRHGEHETFFADDNPGIYGFTRKVAGTDENYAVVFNTSMDSKTVNLPSVGNGYTAVYNSSGTKLDGYNLTVGGLDFAIYKVR